MDFPILVSNTQDYSVKESLRKLSETSDEIRLAVAYFTDGGLIEEWLNGKVKLSIVVALQYPTNPTLLMKLLQHRTKVELKFYEKSSKFHSKLYLFLKAGQPLAALVGSSNFTGDGLTKNIETNVCLTITEHLTPLVQQFEEIWRKADLLTKEVINRYQELYDQTKPERSKLSLKQKQFEKELSLHKEAREYNNFKKCVNEVKEIVYQISKKEWPDVEVYLTIDHFWHWIVKEWDQADISKIQSVPSYRNQALPKLFTQYARWDKSKDNHTLEMSLNASKFRSLLEQNSIHKLTVEQAKWIYKSLHSGGSMKRIFAHEIFVKRNSIKKIRKSLSYLLWSPVKIEQRISDLLKHKKYKLNQFGPSCIQELLGWVHADLPLRNDKADSAVEMLGYKFR